MADLKLAVLISGRGSNLKALIEACAEDSYPAEIVLVISNKPDAKGLEYAKAAKIPTRVIERGSHDSREGFDAAMTGEIEESGAGLVCLAGFMRMLSEDFVIRWRDRLINIHPSLLPSFKGLDVHERVLEAGVKLAGCTVHFVRLGMDEGPVVIQAAVPVLADDDPETLAARILHEEHRIYPEAIRLIAEGRVRVVAGRAFVDDAPAPEGALINPLPS